MMLSLDEFRARRDYFQWIRRIQVLPQLEARKNALRHEIDVLRMLAEWLGILPTKGLVWADFQKAQSNNHKRETLLNAAVEISVELQDVVCQITVIGREHEALTARVPDEWKAQVFAIAEDGKAA